MAAMTATTTTTQQTRAAAERYGPTVARAGWVAKGVVYALIGVLAVQLALGDPSGAPDQQGAIQTVAEQPFGSALLVLLVIGLVAYSIGRWLEASVLAAPDLEALDRAKMVGSGIVYAGFAVLAVRLLTHDGGESQGSARTVTADVMDAPLGRWIVGAVGVAFIGAGLYEGWQAVTKRFMEQLETAGMDHRVRRTTERLGQFGLVARGIAWSLIGWFLVRAAVQFDPREAKGLDQVLRSLADESWGTIVLLVVAVGFIGYGAYCAVQARYRRVGHA